MIRAFGKIHQIDFQNKFFVFMVSIFLGTAWFLFLFGWNSLRFNEVGWAYSKGSDVLQHQLGWEWFRQESWKFPIGRIDSYGYPYGTSLTFMDANPLMSVIFKLLSPILPENFQFIGIWELICIIGQFYMGMLICGEFTPSTAKKILGASILTFSPILIYRSFYHDSLAAQWILLTAILFLIREYKQKHWRYGWTILIAITAMIHLYLFFMLIPLWMVGLYFRYTRNRQFVKCLADVLITTCAVLIISWAFGWFSLSIMDICEGDFGMYSWNLNGFFNPASYSVLFKPLRLISDLQMEGFSYLGLGNLILLPISIFIFFRNCPNRHNYPFFIPVAIISLLFILFAQSNEVYFGDRLLWRFNLPFAINKILAMIRASGRFIWPVFYFIIIFGLVNIIRLPRIAVPILAFALFVQVIDISPLYMQKRITDPLIYESPLRSEFWQEAGKTNKHIIILPAINAHSFYEPFAVFSRQNDLTLNWGYMSRGDYPVIKELGEQAWQELKAGNADDSSLYLIWGEDRIKEAEDTLTGKVPLCTVDGYTVAFSINNGIMRSGLELVDYCDLP
jgi:hypothetical protein